MVMHHRGSLVRGGRERDTANRSSRAAAGGRVGFGVSGGVRRVSSPYTLAGPDVLRKAPSITAMHLRVGALFPMANAFARDAKVAGTVRPFSPTDARSPARCSPPPG